MPPAGPLGAEREDDRVLGRVVLRVRLAGNRIDVDAHDPAAAGKLLFLGVQFVVLSIPLGVLIVFAAEWVAAAFKRSKWVERALNWSFAAIFAAFAATILTAQARH